MGLLSWFTRNWADTDEAGDPAVVPLDLPVPLSDALAHVEKTLRELPRFQIESVDAQQGIVQATRRTRLWGFIDDVTVRLEPIPGGTRVHARSKARVGIGDFGQNRRNLIAFLWALRRSC
jgi:uncharacterized protein (DUF1499 family)